MTSAPQGAAGGQHLQLQDLGRLMEAAIEAGKAERLARCGVQGGVLAVGGQPLGPDSLHWLSLLYLACRCDHNQISVGRAVRPWSKTP
jgi:hypothetical protein